MKWQLREINANASHLSINAHTNGSRRAPEELRQPSMRALHSTRMQLELLFGCSDVQTDLETNKFFKPKHEHWLPTSS